MRLHQLENTVLSQHLLIVVVCLSLFICHGACAQTEDVEPAILDVRVDLARLLPNEPSGETVFLVDDTQQITIVLTANIELTSVSIALPESGTITPENVGVEYDGSFRGFSVGSNPPSACHVLPLMCEPGHHYHFEFPSQGPGEYTILYEAPSGLGGASDAGVLIRMLTDSLIGVATLVLPTSAKVDSPVTIAVIVLDGTGVEGATASAFVRKETAGSYTTVSLLDDGEDADAEADDGIYSGVYTPAEVGNYEVAVTVTGTSRSFDFERHSGSSFTVYDPPAEFSAPLAVSDAGTDTDAPANGLYNRLDIGVEVDVHQTGDYILTAVLEAADESVLINGVHPTDAITTLMTQPLRAESDEADAPPSISGRMTGSKSRVASPPLNSVKKVS